MLKTTKNPKNRSNSKFLHQRRRSFFTKRNAKLGFQFLKQNKGSLTVHKIETGAYKAIFNSKITGRKAHSFGVNFDCAYQNLIRLFHLKYAV